MKNLFSLIVFILFTAGFIACNPDCSSSGSLTLSSDFNPAGYEVLLKAVPLSNLKNKKVFFGKTQAEARFVDSVGLIFKVPQGSIGKTSIKIEDGDCAEYLDFDVKSADFFKKNPNFIFPVVPEIIIPTLPSSFPPSINNAWLNPDNTDYCIWFTIKKDSTKNPNGTYKIFDTVNLDEKNSFEQCTKCCADIDANPLYKKNTMYGIYDTINRNVHFWIKRPNGTEEFDGRFIDTARIINPRYSAQKYDIKCAANNLVKDKPHMILMTSRQTGRQTLIFQKG